MTASDLKPRKAFMKITLLTLLLMANLPGANAIAQASVDHDSLRIQKYGEISQQDDDDDDDDDEDDDDEEEEYSLT